MKNTYESPFKLRYASKEMLWLFSPDMRYQTWRKLWVCLAQAEQELGLDITKEQIDELKEHIIDIDYDVVAEKEKEIRHDVMAHVYAYGLVAQKAKGIIHLGATSCYVTDNADIIIIKEALLLLRKKILGVISRLSDFALNYKDLPALGFTHFQPAQPVTVGKRACLWIQDLIMDLSDLDYLLSTLKLLGSKGTTGTQASFLNLFDGDHSKVKELDLKIARMMGFDSVFDVSGQTYSRKLDSRVLSVLSGIAQSATKFANDVRLLQGLGELEEPFEDKQVGSSAMAYKRNPMRCERMTSIARNVVAQTINPAITEMTQWLERTLDDSANRRIALSEAFLSVDAVLDIFLNVSDGLVVYPNVINKRLMEKLPFMATENIMMEAVRRGGDRQELHEKIRQYSMQVTSAIKLEGKDNNLISLIASDPAFMMNKEELETLLDPKKYVGRAPQQTEEYIKEKVMPMLDGENLSGLNTELKV